MQPNYKQSARLTLKGKWFEAIAVGLIYSAIIAGGTSSSTTSATVSSESDVAFFIMLFSFVITVGLLLIDGAVTLGYYDYNLRLACGQPAPFSLLFSKLSDWKKSLGWLLLHTLYILLWSLLFIIPGIIKSYGYSMSGYLLLQNPNLTPSQSLAESQRMMKGHKMELFMLDLSFIGWMLVSVLTCGIGFLALVPYIQQARAHFFLTLVNSRQTNYY